MQTKDQLLSSIGSILSVMIKASDGAKYDQILISKTRAKELLANIKHLQKSDKKVCSKHMRREPAWLTNPD
jgi:hypothetical protein